MVNKEEGLLGTAGLVVRVESIEIVKTAFGTISNAMKVYAAYKTPTSGS